MNRHPDLPEESASRAEQRPLQGADNVATSGVRLGAGLTAVAIARQIDELVRALNYATLAPQPRLEFAADVYEVLGSLYAALTKLPQACGQLSDFLARHDAAGNLRAERGFPHGGRPALAVKAARFKLGQAAVAANVTATALGRAQEAISGLSYVESEGPLAGRPRSAGPPQPRDHAAPDRGQAIER
jgi:hypothetical protein